MKMLKIFVFLMLVLTLAVSLATVSVAAKTSKKKQKSPYKDVTVESVGEDGVKSVTHVEECGGLEKFHFKNGLFKPKKILTKKEGRRMVGGVFGYKYLPKTSKRGKATVKWFCKLILGTITNKWHATFQEWYPKNKKKVSRVWGCQLLMRAMEFDNHAFDPLPPEKKE